MQTRKQFSDIKTNLEKNRYYNNFQNNNESNNNINNNNSNKAILNFNKIINNLKISLEKFDSSIKELKLNIDKDKEEQSQKIQELEETFNSKLNSLKTGQIYSKPIHKGKNEPDISPSIIKELFSKINLLEQKSKSLESNLNNKLLDYDNKKEPEYNSRTNKKNSESPMGKNIENLVKQKIEECLDKKLDIIDEKIQILNNKVINLEIRSQNRMYDRSMGDNSFLIDNSFSEVMISDKFDKKIQALNKNMNSKLIKLANKLGIDDLQDIGLDNSYMNINLEKNNDIKDNDNMELDMKLMNEISNKFKLMKNDLENKIKISIDNKINDIKRGTNSQNDKSFDNSRENNSDINNKISFLKSELSKMIEAKNSNFDNKIKNLDNKINNCLIENKSCLESINSLETKIKTLHNKIRLIDNKFANISEPYQNNISSFANSRNLYAENSEQKNSNSNLSFSKLSVYKSINLDTNILNKEDLTEDFFLFSKIKETFNYNMTIMYKLIYRATKHGDTAKDFHQKCDYIGPNLIIVKTTKNFIFGGVTSKSWKHLLKDIIKDDPENGTEIKDEKAFGFSINLKKIYLNGNPNEFAIFCNNNYGPIFNNIYFKIFDECLKNGGICGKISESNFIGMEKDYEFNGEEEQFEVEDIEIFQIGFK